MQVFEVCLPAIRGVIVLNAVVDRLVAIRVCVSQKVGGFGPYMDPIISCVANHSDRA